MNPPGSLAPMIMAITARLSASLNTLLLFSASAKKDRHQFYNIDITLCVRAEPTRSRWRVFFCRHFIDSGAVLGYTFPTTPGTPPGLYSNLGNSFPTCEGAALLGRPT